MRVQWAFEPCPLDRSEQSQGLWGIPLALVIWIVDHRCLPGATGGLLPQLWEVTSEIEEKNTENLESFFFHVLYMFSKIYVCACVCVRVRVLRTVYINYTSFTASPRKYRKVKSPHNSSRSYIRTICFGLSVSYVPGLSQPNPWDPGLPLATAHRALGVFNDGRLPFTLIKRLSGGVRVKDLFFMGILHRNLWGYPGNYNIL